MARGSASRGSGHVALAPEQRDEILSVRPGNPMTVELASRRICSPWVDPDAYYGRGC